MAVRDVGCRLVVDEADRLAARDVLVRGGDGERERDVRGHRPLPAGLRRGRRGDHARAHELAEFHRKLKYTKDSRGICYAVLANKTDGFRTTLTFAEVDCGRLP